MMNLIKSGYRHIPYCMLLAIYILLLPLFSTVKAQADLCTWCQLNVKDEPQAYANFTQILQTKEIKAIFFNFYVGNQPVHKNKGYENPIFFAWVKRKLGIAVFTLPGDYVALTFSLYKIFISTLKINFQESPPDCYRRISKECKDVVTFITLVNFTRLSQNCTNDNCGTICKRSYGEHDGTVTTKIDFSCCQKDLLTGKVNIAQCLKEDTVNWYVPLMQVFTLAVSIYLSGIALNEVFDNYLERQIMYTTIGSIPVHILNPLPLQELGYAICYNSDPSYHYKPIIISLQYLLFTIVSVAAGILSYFIQSLPLMFMIYPRIKGLNIHSKTIHLILRVAVPFSIATIIIIIAHLKLFWSDASRKVKANQHRYLTRISYQQSYFLIANYLKAALYHLRLRNLTGFILNCLSLAGILPFFLAIRISIFRVIFFISERLTLNLKEAYLSNNPKWRFINPAISVCISSLCFCHIGVNIMLLFMGIQLVFRIIISIIAFVVAYSAYFSPIIVMGIPFMHYLIQILNVYNKNCSRIPTKIMQLRDVVEDRMNSILNAEKAVLEVFIINDYDEIRIDVPEMLKDPQVKKKLEIYAIWILNQPHHQIIDGISKIVIQYEIKIMDDDRKQTTVSLLQCTSGCKSCPFLREFEGVKYCIETYLNSNSCQDFLKYTKQVYFIQDDIAHYERISIPSELYEYLRYYMPSVSLSLWQIISNIILVLGIFFIFILTVLLDYRVESYSSLNSAIANTPVIYVVMLLSINYFKVSEVDEETVDRILIANIIQYRRGYRFFFERGAYFQPILQFFRVTFGRYNQINTTERLHTSKTLSSNNQSSENVITNGNQFNTSIGPAGIENNENESSQANLFIKKGEIQFRLILQAIKNAFTCSNNRNENGIVENVGINTESELLIDRSTMDPIA
ncbi:hypothetical protein TrispH2_008795 [Trichoplax sp. H2]|nr:hypothetical protein TrispH2_008795 [Trichoplax sp. H2]|eukprot:RDD39958.1 hypothetical protein TrispH2_008795 [Trichoplax sp. H2]